MKDFRVNLNDGAGIVGDLVIEPSQRDIASQSDVTKAALERIAESFEMTEGDELSAPGIYSSQRAALSSVDRQSLVERIQDAERILQSHRDVDRKSINVDIGDDGKLHVSCKLVTGERIALRR